MTMSGLIFSKNYNTIQLRKSKICDLEERKLKIC